MASSDVVIPPAASPAMQRVFDDDLLAIKIGSFLFAQKTWPDVLRLAQKNKNETDPLTDPRDPFPYERAHLLLEGEKEVGSAGAVTGSNSKKNSVGQSSREARENYLLISFSLCRATLLHRYGGVYGNWTQTPAKRDAVVRVLKSCGAENVESKSSENEVPSSASGDEQGVISISNALASVPQRNRIKALLQLTALSMKDMGNQFFAMNSCYLGHAVQLYWGATRILIGLEQGEGNLPLKAASSASSSDGGSSVTGRWKRLVGGWVCRRRMGSSDHEGSSSSANSSSTGASTSSSTTEILVDASLYTGALNNCCLGLLKVSRPLMAIRLAERTETFCRSRLGFLERQYDENLIDKVEASVAGKAILAALTKTRHRLCTAQMRAGRFGEAATTIERTIGRDDDPDSRLRGIGGTSSKTKSDFPSFVEPVGNLSDIFAGAKRTLADLRRTATQSAETLCVDPETSTPSLPRHLLLKEQQLQAKLTSIKQERGLPENQKAFDAQAEIGDAMLSCPMLALLDMKECRTLQRNMGACTLPFFRWLELAQDPIGVNSMGFLLGWMGPDANAATLRNALQKRLFTKASQQRTKREERRSVEKTFLAGDGVCEEAPSLQEELLRMYQVDDESLRTLTIIEYKQLHVVRWWLVYLELDAREFESAKRNLEMLINDTTFPPAAKFEVDPYTGCAAHNGKHLEFAKQERQLSVDECRKIEEIFEDEWEGFRVEAPVSEDAHGITPWPQISCVPWPRVHLAELLFLLCVCEYARGDVEELASNLAAYFDVAIETDKNYHEAVSRLGTGTGEKKSDV